MVGLRELRSASLLPWWALVSLCIATSCRTRPLAESGVRGEDAPGLPADRSAISFQGLRQIIDQDKVRSVEGMLAKLPKSFLARHVLLFQSDSTQVASPSQPRVILYSEGARLLVTFNGAAADGGDRLETIEFQPKDGKFIFREIEFPSKDDMTSPVKVSPDNPVVCRSCHHAQMRPIFDTWPEWPFAYFGKVTTAPGASHDPQQKVDFAAFKSKAATDLRYRYLEGLDKHSEPDFQSSGGGAAVLSELILDRLDDMVVGEILRHPNYQKWKVALHGAVFGCDSFADWMPKSDTIGPLTMTLAQVRQNTLNGNPKASETFIRLRWLFQLVGKNVQNWSGHPTTFFNFERAGGKAGPFPGVGLARSSDLSSQLKNAVDGDRAAGTPWKAVCTKLAEMVPG